LFQANFIPQISITSSSSKASHVRSTKPLNTTTKLMPSKPKFPSVASSNNQTRIQ
jgi:hypothetical protein